MNKNIQTMASEAGLYRDGAPDSFDSSAVEQFAKLLALHFINECRNVSLRAEEARKSHEQSEFGDAFNQGQQVGALACAGTILRFIEEENND